MPKTILPTLKKIPSEFVVGAFYSKDKKTLNYYCHERTSEDLKERISRNTMEKPAYLVRVIPKKRS